MASNDDAAQGFLDDAHDHIEKGKYSEALAIYIWFGEIIETEGSDMEALAQGFDKRRLLPDWEELAESFEPARAALETFKNSTEPKQNTKAK